VLGYVKAELSLSLTLIVLKSRICERRFRLGYEPQASLQHGDNGTQELENSTAQKKAAVMR